MTGWHHRYYRCNGETASPWKIPLWIFPSGKVFLPAVYSNFQFFMVSVMNFMTLSNTLYIIIIIIINNFLGDLFVFQNPRNFYESHFFRTDSALWIYQLSVWSNLNLLYNSQRINFPSQLCLLLYSFCASFLHLLIMWLTVYYYFTILRFFYTSVSWGFSTGVWLTASLLKSPQVSRTLFSILADQNDALVWLVSTRPLISKSFSPCTNPLVCVPIKQITIGITVIFIFHNFFQFSNKV